MKAHMNMLNTALQGKGRTGLGMVEDVLTLKCKLTVFARDLQSSIVSQFDGVQTSSQTIISNYLQSAITAMQTLFRKWFCEFRVKKKNTLSFPVAPQASIHLN